MRAKTKGSCPTRKRRYADGYTAQLALDTVRRERLGHGEVERIEQRIYECRHCSGWHLTSHDEDERTVRRRRDAAEVLRPQ